MLIQIKKYMLNHTNYTYLSLASIWFNAIICVIKKTFEQVINIIAKQFKHFNIYSNNTQNKKILFSSHATF